MFFWILLVSILLPSTLLPEATTVDNVDGTRIIYHYTKTFLPERIEFYNEHQQLVKQTLYEWDADQRLASLQWVDRDHCQLCRISYEYDKFGNPIVESLTGDLTGRGTVETCTTRRLFSDDGRHLLLREEHEAGRVMTFQYLPNTNLMTTKLTQDGNTILSREFWEYDERHHLIQAITDDGLSTEKYDLSGVKQRLITSYVLRTKQPFLHMREWTEESYWEEGQIHLLKRTHHCYDQYGNVCQDSVYGADGQLAYHLYRTYDASGNLVSETNAMGQIASYCYDDHGRRTFSRDLSGKLDRRMQYDARGRLQQQLELGRDGAQHKTTYHYDANDRMIQVTDPLGNITHYTYDLVANKVATEKSSAMIAQDGSTVPVIKQTSYDAFGRKLAEIDAIGNKTSFRCNAYGEPVEITYADGSRESFFYTKSGKIQQYVNRSGLITTYTYDALERVTKTTYTSAKQELIAEELQLYQGQRLVSETDKEGHVTTYLYDGAGRKRSETRCGRTSDYSYDNLGRLVTTTNQNGKNTLITRFKLDLLGRVIETSKWDLSGLLLHQIGHAYDEAGNRIATIRYPTSREAVQRTSYDAFNRCLSHTDALGHTTLIHYDETQRNILGQGVLTRTTTDPNGVMTVITYDPYHREIGKEMRKASKGIISAQEMSYDVAGNLLERRDHIYLDGIYQRTQRTAYTYDNCHRVSSLTRAAGSVDTRTTYFNYTENGLLACKTLPSGITLHYNYDCFENLQSISSSDGKLTLTFRHDRLGNLLHATDELLNSAIDRTVDAFGNVLSERFPLGLTVSKTYDALDRPLTLAWSDRARIDYGYDPAYLRSVSHTSASDQVLYSHHYDEYDLDGNLKVESPMGGLKTVSHAVDLKGRQTDIASSYYTQHSVYDAVDHLVHSSIDKSDWDYSYDDLSQLNSETTRGSTRTFLHDSHYNRVFSDEVPALVNDLDELLSSGLIHCTYDVNGNLITKETPTENWSYTYDPLNRLTHASSNTQRVEISYDPLGRRLSKVVHSQGYFGWVETCREHYLYDGDNEIGSFSAQGKPKQVRTLGLAKHKNLPATVSIELDGKLYVPILDCQGNICRLINPTWGTTAESYQFDAFGKELNDPASYRNPWRYASKRIDSELALVYFGKRYYDPQLARWLTTDPAGFVDSTNLYTYLLNNPFRYVDPDGRFVIALPLLTWGCAGLGIALPTLTTVVTTALVTTAVWYATETTLTHLGQYVAQKEWEWEMNKDKFPAKEFVGTPSDLEKDPKWTETTHPDARKKGRREFTNSETGDVIEYDKGRPGATGHKAHDHYHHQNPHSTGPENEYFDNKGKTCPKGKESYHIYPPEGLTWNY